MRVLVVEDNPINLRLAMHQITKLGGKPEGAANGREAVEALARNGYDAVLMDCQMPELDGYEASREIRRREAADADPADRPILTASRPIWIVAMTANAMDGDRDKCIAAGMDDYVSKPVTLDALREVLERAEVGRSEVRSTPDSGRPDQSPTAPSSAEPLDAGIIAELRSEKAGLLCQLIDLFTTATPGKLDAMERALVIGDLEEVAFGAHNLKGIAGNLGARRMAELCQAIENDLRSGAPAAAAESLNHLRREHRRVVTALLREREASRGQDAEL